MFSLIENLSTVATWIFKIVLYCGLAVLLAAYIWSLVNLLKLKKKIELFFERSERKNFEGVRLDYKRFKKIFLTSWPITAVLVFWFSFGLMVHSHNLIVRIFIMFLPVSVVAAAVLGLIVIYKGDKAELIYRNLYPPVPTINAHELIKAEGFTLHGEEKMFETLAEKDGASENLNLEIFGEADPELMEYVGGGKARAGEETAVPVPKEDNSELKACPLCGSLNPIAAKSCDFCGGDLPETEAAEENTAGDKVQTEEE